MPSICGRAPKGLQRRYCASMRDFYDVVVIGAGAAGVGAGRRLAASGADFLLLDARERLGGRAHTVMCAEAPLDLGCGWLHSADRNVLTALAEAAGFSVDRAEAPWQKQTGHHGMTAEEQAQFRRAFARFEERIEWEAEQNEPRAAAEFLEPGCRWNALINAVFSYISGASLDQIDARDYARYEDTGCNWRIREGYGAVIAASGADLPVALGVEATAIDHSGLSVRVSTSRGDVRARAVIVTAPTSRLVDLAFAPDLPAKREAAAALPMGHAEKVHFALERAEEFPADGHLFARIDRPDTGSYHVRPMGRPLIEAYFGGALAGGLAAAGDKAMSQYAKDELAALLGSSFPSRLTFLAASRWSLDPFSRGAYSYARPGCAEARTALSAPHENRIFFAGEACSRSRYSTAHGAFETGVAAADIALEAIKMGE